MTLQHWRRVCKNEHGVKLVLQGVVRSLLFHEGAPPTKECDSVLGSPLPSLLVSVLLSCFFRNGLVDNAFWFKVQDGAGATADNAFWVEVQDGAGATARPGGAAGCAAASALRAAASSCSAIPSSQSVANQ